MYTSIMRRTQMYIEESQHQALRAQARRQGKTMASLFREIIDVYLAGGLAPGRDDPLAGVIGLGEGTGEAVAENYEEYLYGEPS